MNNITKIKLINSLIDAVSHFYDLKQRGQESQHHLKGFCEGLAYGLVGMKVINKTEAKRILKGLGKRIEEDKKDKETKVEKEDEKTQKIDPDDLDVPTVFRKKSTPDSNLI
jgi:hypothetical protein